VTPSGSIVWLALEPAAPSPTDWFSILAQYGVLGIGALGLFLVVRDLMKRDQQRADEQVARERERADRLEAQLSRLHETTAEKVIPALVTAAQVIEDTQVLIREMVRDRGRS